MSSKSNQSNESNVFYRMEGARSWRGGGDREPPFAVGGVGPPGRGSGSRNAVERVAPPLLSLVGVIEYPQGKGNVSV
jgi:hypothetical protein